VEKENVISYLQWIAQQLKIQHKEDWYIIHAQQLHSMHGTILLRKYGGLEKLLESCFPGNSNKILYYSILPKKSNGHGGREWVNFLGMTMEW
jgi:hypothetical protein